MVLIILAPGILENLTISNFNDVRSERTFFNSMKVAMLFSIFNEILCAIFISLNAFLKFLSYELTLVIHGYDQRISKVDLHSSGL